MKQQEQDKGCFPVYVTRVKMQEVHIHKAHAMLSTALLLIQLLSLSNCRETAFLIMYIQHLAQLSRTSRLY